MSPADPDPLPGAQPGAETAPADPVEAEAVEAEAWAAVLAAWEDDGSHRAYLARAVDLDGLARAGRRYRAVLEGRAHDAVAARWRDEIVKRATVAGLAQLPRTRPPVATKLPRRVRSIVIACLVALVVGLVLGFGKDLLAGLEELWPR